MTDVPIIKITLKDAGIQCLQKHCLKCHRDNIFHLADAREYFYGVKCDKCKTEVWGKESPSRSIYKNIIKKMNEAGLASGKNSPPVDFNLSYEERREKSAKETARIMNYFLGDLPPCPCCGSVFSEWNFGWPDIYKNCLHCKSENMTPYADVTKDHLEDEVYWFDD